MQLVLVFCTLIIVLVTVLPLSENQHWIVRGMDFPRLQIAIVSATALIAHFIFLDIQMISNWVIIGGTIACLIWQLWWILPYTCIWPKEVRAARDTSPEKQLSILTSNVLTPNRNSDSLIKLVKKHKPDVLVTLESDQWWEDKLTVLEETMPYSIKCPLSNLYGMHVFSKKDNDIKAHKLPFDAGAIHLTFDALRSVKRPASTFGWSQFIGARRVAWKTGTSIGFRDAWAVGVTPEYVVAVWAGNADGEGRPELVGVKTAAPILFEVFDILPKTAWFETPFDDLRTAEVCDVSGHPANSYCPKTSEKYIHKNGRRALPCPYHEQYFTDVSGVYAVTSNCFSSYEMKSAVYFNLPPAMMAYYRRQHTDIEQMKPSHPDCESRSKAVAFEILYPHPQARIKVPKELDGNKGSTIFEVAHVDEDASIFWHVDHAFIGKTTHKHAMPVRPKPGQHHLKVVDQNGNEMVREFEVLR